MTLMMQVRQIPLKEIQADFLFCFHARLDDPLLVGSIRRSGIRTPLLVESVENRYRIVSGFRRIHAAKALGVDAVPAVLIESASAYFVDVVREQRVLGTLNLVEKARILSVAERIESDWNDLLQVLDLADQPRQARAIQGLLALPLSVLTYIEQYDVSLKKCRMFEGIPETVLNKMIRTANALQIRSVELAEILNGMKEIARQSGDSIETVHEQLIRSFLNPDDLNRNQRIQAMKDWLLVRRHPKLTVWNASIASANEALNLPSTTQLSWDKSLESPGVRLNVQLHSEQDVAHLAKTLSDPQKQSIWKTLFDIL